MWWLMGPCGPGSQTRTSGTVVSKRTFLSGNLVLRARPFAPGAPTLTVICRQSPKVLVNHTCQAHSLQRSGAASA